MKNFGFRQALTEKRLFFPKNFVKKVTKMANFFLVVNPIFSLILVQKLTFFICSLCILAKNPFFGVGKQSFVDGAFVALCVTTNLTSCHNVKLCMSLTALATQARY